MRRHINDNVGITGSYTLTFKDEQGNTTKTINKKNLVMNSALFVVAELLTNTANYESPKINYFVVGTGQTTPQSSDTQLEAEIDRKFITSQSVQGNVIRFSTFFTKTEAVGTLGEVGLFFNGGSDPNSGILFSRIAGGTELPVTKNDTETLTIDYQLTIN